jgi:hypothetical protein
MKNIYLYIVMYIKYISYIILFLRICFVVDNIILSVQRGHQKYVKLFTSFNFDLEF